VNAEELVTEAAAIGDLARRATAAEAEGITWIGERPDHIVARVLRDDEHLVVQDHEAMAEVPRRSRGTATLRDGASFAAYVNRLRTSRTTAWANVRPVGGGVPTITAVFNDHDAAEASGEAGWRDHTARLEVQLDDDWKAWVGASGQMMSQRDFAQFLLDHVHNIDGTDGDVGKVMMAVLKFRAQRKVDYESHVNLTNGQATFAYVETVGQEKSRGSVTLPEDITVNLFPFAGATEAEQAFPVKALLRYDAAGDGLKLGYKLVRPDKTLTEAWDRLAGEVAALIPDVPMLQGVAPTPVGR